MGYGKLLLMAFLFDSVVYLIYKVDRRRREKLGRPGGWGQQIVIGIIFGGLAMLATTFGIDIDGAIINVRDAAPLCAGLIFGAPAGIIAGLIGGIGRWYGVYWGAGTYTRLACSVSTVLAGLLAALLRKKLLDDKKPTWAYGLIIAMVMEVFHMLMIFITNMGDIQRDFAFVRQCAFPMIAINGLCVMIALLIIAASSPECRVRSQGQQKIVQTFERWLFLCVALAFLAASSFIFLLQTTLAEKDLDTLLGVQVSDISRELSTSGSGRVSAAATDRHIGSLGGIILADASGRIISDSRGNAGQMLSDVGLALQGVSPGTRFESTVYQWDSYALYGIQNGIAIIAYMPVSEVFFTRDVTAYVVAFMEVLVFAALFVTIYYLIKRKVVDNIQQINGSLAQITSGNLDVTVDVRSNVEFASLSDDINITVKTLKQYIAEAAQRIDQELAFAKAVQYASLPDTFKPFPEYAGIFDIYATMETAREVGGDFFDFYLLDPDHLVFLVADVSGKGIPAAMFMMTVKTLLKSVMETGVGVADAMTGANAELCAGNDEGMFVTVWMGELKISTGVVHYVNAGHNPPYLKQEGAFAPLQMKRNLVLGGMEGIQYVRQTLPLKPGDTLFLYTDGVTEAVDDSHALYGERRLQAVLNARSGDCGPTLTSAVLQDIDAFVGDAAQFDDITMLVLKYEGGRCGGETGDLLEG
jgi:serine phosphatase RsbU (regulator of sigma subunit)